MIDPAITLLPYRGLDQSLLLPVLVGVVVLALFTELMGVAFVGVVVPGYLSAVAIAQPTAAVGIVLEAVATYLIARGLSDSLRRSDVWAVFFGRERFFFIVIVSVFVRQNTQTWLFADGSGWIAQATGLDVQGEGELMSIGLVLVPLLANMFWKPGLRRGFVHVLAPLAVTYVVLDSILLPYTNLSLSSLELSFESVAIDFVASGKAYIVMLTAALFAARFNLRYGWDFGGILVPALLAVVWLEPAKIGTTVLEGLVLVGVTAAALRLPGLRTLNLEGPRKLAIVFALGFGLKYAAGWTLGESYPAMKVTELFGFGYLLPALIAVKVLEQRAVARVVMPTVLTSLLGFVVGSAIGFGLEIIAPRTDEPTLVASTIDVAQGHLLPDRPYSFVLDAAADAHTKVTEGLATPGSSGDTRRSELRLQLGAWVSAGGPIPDVLRDAAQRRGLSIRPLADPTPFPGPVFVVEPSANARKSATMSALVRPGADGPWLFVPRPRTEPLSAPGAVMLCAQVSCGAIFISAVDEGGQADPLESEMRAMSTDVQPGAVFVRVPERTESGGPVLHVRGKLPASSYLAGLSTQPAELRWDPPPSTTTWMERSGDVVLRVPQSEMAGMLGALDPQRVATPPIGVWLARRWQERDQPDALPRLQTSGLIALQREVERLITAIVNEDQTAVAASASIFEGMGLAIVRFDDCEGPGSCWVLDLTESLDVLVAIRSGPAEPLAVYVSAAGTELGAGALGSHIWSGEHARVLVLGDVGRQTGAGAAIEAIHRAVDRALRAQSGALALHVRGLADHRAMTSEVLWGLDRPILDDHQVPIGIERLRASIGVAGELFAIATPIDGTPRFAGLGNARAHSSFSRRTGGIDVATLWIGSEIRRRWVRKSVTPSERLAVRVGLELQERSPEAAAMDGLGRMPWTASAEAGPGFLDEARRFSVSRNVKLMRRLAGLARDVPGLELELGWDALRGRRWLMAGEHRPGVHERVLLLDSDSNCPLATVEATDPMATEELARAVNMGCQEVTVTWHREEARP